MTVPSLACKTFALGLAPHQASAAIILWLAGAGLDAWQLRRGKPGAPPAGAIAREVLLWNAAALVLGIAAALLCDQAALRWKEGIPPLAAIGARLLTLSGAQAAAAGGVVLMTTMAGPLEFAASIDAMALKIPALFLVLAFARLLFAGTPVVETLRRGGIIAFVLLVLAVIHLAAVIMLADFVFGFAGYDTEELPWRPFMDQTARMLLHIPLLAAAWPLLGRLLAAPAATTTTTATAAASPLPRRWWIAPPVALLAAFAFCHQPAGTRKTGDIVIADWHAQWSQAARPYDREWYGADSGYNYACLRRLFGLFRNVRLTGGPLAASDLRDASVLVVYVPDRAFNPDQIKMIRDFVREGGGLFLIGDHTNVFGSTTHLNELCQPLGFEFRDDVLFDLDEDFHQVIDAPRLGGSSWHGIDFFKLRGPASIRSTSLWTRPVWQVGHSKAVRAIYSVNNFYPPPHDDPKMTFGDFCVAATAHYGRGRVAAWADSTVFSNFEIYYPGKYEYLLNTIHWLDHRDSTLTGMLRRFGLLVLAGGTLALLLAFRHPRLWLAILGTTAGAWLLALVATRWLETRRAAFPEPVTPSDWVVFLADRDDPAHNLRGFVNESPYDQRFEVFIQWVLRTGAMSGYHLADQPRANGLYRHLAKSPDTRLARALIVRSPADLPKLRQLAALTRDQPGPVLLMVTSAVTRDQMLEAIQLSGLASAESAAELAAAWPAGEASTDAGHFALHLVAGAERFSDQAMGLTEKVVPDAATRALFDQAFAVIDRLFDRPPPATPADAPEPAEPPGD